MHGACLRYGKFSSMTAPIKKSATSARAIDPACQQTPPISDIGETRNSTGDYFRYIFGNRLYYFVRRIYEATINNIRRYLIRCGYLPHRWGISLFTPPPGSRVRRPVGHSTCMSVLARRSAIIGSIVQPKRPCLGAATAGGVT